MPIHAISFWDVYSVPVMCRPALKCATSPLFEHLEDRLCTVAEGPIVLHHRSIPQRPCVSLSWSWFVDSLMGRRFCLAATLVCFWWAAIPAIRQHRQLRECVNADWIGTSSFFWIYNLWHCPVPHKVLGSGTEVYFHRQRALWLIFVRRWGVLRKWSIVLAQVSQVTHLNCSSED